MSLCRICGEEGHRAARCKELTMPPDELYTGPCALGSEEARPGAGADHDGDDGGEESYTSSLWLSSELQQLVQICLLDGETQSKQPTLA